METTVRPIVEYYIGLIQLNLSIIFLASLDSFWSTLWQHLKRCRRVFSSVWKAHGLKVKSRGGASMLASVHLQKTSHQYSSQYTTLGLQSPRGYLSKDYRDRRWCVSSRSFLSSSFLWPQVYPAPHIERNESTSGGGVVVGRQRQNASRWLKVKKRVSKKKGGAIKRDALESCSMLLQSYRPLGRPQPPPPSI